ncbi:MFS transporter, partial [Thermodesulfobacteriota bacterium]
GRFIPCLIVSVILQVFSPDTRPEKKEKADIFEILKRKDFWIITVLWLSCAIASMGIYNIIPLYLVKERAIQIESANTIFGISRIGGFIAMVSMGFLMDRFKLKRILTVIILSTGLTTIGIALAHSYLLVSIMLFAQATFAVVFFPAGLVAISRLTTLNERSVFTGLLMSISSPIGSGLSPLILGVVADVWNFQVGILISGIIITMSYFPLRSLKEI